MEFVCNWGMDWQWFAPTLGIWHFCFTILSKIGLNQDSYVNQDSFIIFAGDIKDAEWSNKIISAIIFQ